MVNSSRLVLRLSPDIIGWIAFVTMLWTSEAKKYLDEVPFLIRPIVKKGVEKKAESAQKVEIDGPFFLEVKASRGR